MWLYLRVHALNTLISPRFLFFYARNKSTVCIRNLMPLLKRQKMICHHTRLKKMTIYHAHLWEFQPWGKSRQVLMCARYYTWKLCAIRVRNAVLWNNLKFVSSPSKRQVSSTSKTSGTRDWYEIQSFLPCRHRSAFHLNDDMYKTSHNVTNQSYYPFLLWFNSNDTLRAWGIIRLCNRPSIKRKGVVGEAWSGLSRARFKSIKTISFYNFFESNWILNHVRRCANDPKWSRCSVVYYGYVSRKDGANLPCLCP